MFLNYTFNWKTKNNGGNHKENIKIYVYVLDKNTVEPIRDVTIFVGYSVPIHICKTDNNGKCEIDGLTEGDYSIGARKKGYTEKFQEVKIVKGENKFYLYLERSNVKNVEIEGIIIEEVVAIGTRSENHYFKIIDNEENSQHIFNEAGFNIGFEEYVNKKVKVVGYRDFGYIGWERKKVEGIVKKYL